MGLSLKSRLAAMPPEKQAAWLAEQEPWVLEEMLAKEWWYIARPEQQAPPGDWFVWLLLSGRGFGKTRTAAEWLADRVLKLPFDTAGFRTEWLLIAETLSDAMHLCVNGPAGIARVLERKLGPQKKHPKAPGRWRISRGGKPYIQLYDELDNEAQVIYIEGADDEDVGRGYNASGAWLDEFAKWKKPDGSWTEGIMPSLRADLPGGEYPRVIVATTPKLVVQLVEWQDRTDGTVHLTTGSTYDNASNLAAPILAEMHRRYAGTRLGEQELMGKLIRDIEGSLWKLHHIEPWRVTSNQLPGLGLRVIGMDPAGSGVRDETGLVCAARGENGHDYVLGDWSKRVAGAAAARLAWEMYNAYSADFIVVETNMGKRWLVEVLEQEYKAMQREGIFPPGGQAPIKQVTAKVGKRLRAEPVAARYEQGNRIHHVEGQGLNDLETQMISWVPDETPDSPDRVDALVYAELMLFEREGRSVGAASPLGRQLVGVGSMGPLATRMPGQR
jgi:phage terminase large subunit-like protein